MTPVLANIMLAIAWTLMVGELSPGQFTTGLAIGFLVLALVGRFVGAARYAPRLIDAFVFAVLYIWEVLLANLRVAYDIVTPTHHMQPGIIAYPYHVDEGVPLMLLANLITMTPGTVSMDVDTQCRVLYVHAMYIEDPEEIRAKIAHFEQQLLQVFQ